MEFQFGKLNKNFFVFEGLDGSGKSLQIEMLEDYFSKLNLSGSILFTREHTRESEYSKQIDELIHNPSSSIPARELQQLYIKDRKWHIQEVIGPALDLGKKVFCDRYFLSTLAYGSLDESVGWKILWEDHKDIIGDDFVLPERTIFFDVPPDVALGRVTKRGGLSNFEKLDKLSIIRKAYLDLKNEFDFEVVDGDRKPEEIFVDVCRILGV